MPNSEVLKVTSEYKPAGDQPKQLKRLLKVLKAMRWNKFCLSNWIRQTFTMAKIIEKLQRPTLILAPNKTLAAQLYGEMKSFFPDNAAEYFVSYYDYYISEAYVRSNTYIEKEASINEQIDRMRHSATQSLLERKDVVIVASVSCIYGIGSVETYRSMTIRLEKIKRLDEMKLFKNSSRFNITETTQIFIEAHLECVET